MSFHSGRTKVPGSSPMSLGRVFIDMSFILVFIDGVDTLGGVTFRALYPHR